MEQENFSIKKLSAEEMARIGVFISYSHLDDEKCNSLIQTLEKNKFNVLSDKLISAGTKNFHEVIRRMLVNSTCGVMLYDGNQVTPWVNFEIGVLEGLGKDIIVFTFGGDTSALPDYLRKYYATSDVGELMEIVKTKKLFSDIFKGESHQLTRENFLKEILNKLGYVYLRLKISGISKIDPAAFKFRYLITGLFKLEKETEERDRDFCAKNYVDLSTCCCRAYKKYGRCAYAEFTLPENCSDIVTLNKVYEAQNVYDNDIVEFLIPVNLEFGTTFKCFVDILDVNKKKEIIGALVNAQIIKYDESGSGVGGRIYFTLPAKEDEGLFQVIDERNIDNNYLCPGVVSE